MFTVPLLSHSADGKQQRGTVKGGRASGTAVEPARLPDLWLIKELG